MNFAAVTELNGRTLRVYHSCRQKNVSQVFVACPAGSKYAGLSPARSTNFSIQT